MNPIESQKVVVNILEAMKANDIQALRSLLLEDPGRLSMATYTGTLLHKAVLVSSLESVKLLVAMGIDINRRRDDVPFETALHNAARDGKIDIARHLLDHGARMETDDINRNPLFAAIYGGHTDMAKLLLDRGIDIHVSYPGRKIKSMDPMAYAREWGRIDIMEHIQDRQWSADHPDGGRNLVKEFCEAMRSGAFAVQALLDEDSSRIHLITPFGTLLHEAVRLGDLETVKLLLNRGVDINRKTEGFVGSSALYHAICNGRLDVVRCLLDHGAEMDITSELQNPLFAAISYQQPEIARLLLDRGIDFTVKYKSHPKDAMAYAKYWEANEIVKLLKDKMKGAESKKRE